MKKITKVFEPLLLPVCFLLLSMMASCTSDDESVEDVTTGISLHIKTVTRATDGSVNTGVDAENKIENVHIWFFAADAGEGDQALYCYTSPQAILSTNGELALNITDEELALHHGMNSQGAYQLFVVANLPADATIGADTSLGDLKSYSYAASVRPGSPFCMTGNTNGAHDFAIDSRVNIPLLRVVSRLDVKIVNVTGKKLQVNKISIGEDQKSVQLFAPASDAPAPTPNTFGTAMEIYAASTAKDEVNCSGYVYENRSGTPAKIIIDGTIDGTHHTWTREIRPEGASLLPRNTICDMTLKLKDNPVPTDVDVTIRNWNEEPIETAFTNTYMDVDKSEVGVMFVEGGVVGIRSNAEFIHVNWASAPGFYLDGYEDKTEATLAITDEHLALLFYFQGASDVVIPDGTVTITIGNLRKVVQLKKMDSNFIFIPSVKINGHEIHSGDVVPADFWGSTKDEEEVQIFSKTNFTWAFKCVLLGAQDYGADFASRVVYQGVAGAESRPNLFSTIPVYASIDVFKQQLPIDVTITFYLNSSEPPYNGVILSTIHFTIE